MTSDGWVTDADIDSFKASATCSPLGGRYYLAETADADGARDRCASAAYAFHDHLRTRHPDLVDENGYVADATMLTCREPWHRANLAGGTVIDWTYRQFDPSVAWPLIEPLDIYSARWQRVTEFYTDRDL